MKKRLKKMEEKLPSEEILKKKVSRKAFVAGAGATSFGLLLAACGGDDDSAEPAPPPEPAPEEPAPAEPAPAEPAPAEPAAPTEEPAPTKAPPEAAPLHDGLAEGMYGGPTGFDGAERYQYPLDSEEGRAIFALREMVEAGTAPDSLVVQVLNFARPQFETAFPEGAPSHVQLFEEETGIKLEFVETTPEEEYQDNLQNAATQNGSFDLVTSAIEEQGDFAEAGLLLPLDEFVEKHQPQWLDPEFGYAGGESIVNLFTKYKGSTYFVAFDNDTQPNAYRVDLFNHPTEQANFEDQFGRPLRFPITWEEHAEVAQFFTRDAGAQLGDETLQNPFFGAVERKAVFWGIVNWQQRFVPSMAPNMVYFNDDMSANVNNAEGINAADEHKTSLQWSEPGALTKDWLAQYQLMGQGQGLMGGTFPNVTKLFRSDPDFPFIAGLETEVSPGRIVDGQLIRRPVVFFNISYGVNAFADSSRHEAAYLFLQWAGGARVYTWLTGNLAGYQDPHHTYSLDDPLVAVGYGEQPLEKFGEIIPRTAPPITLRGGISYRQALDEELQKHLTDQQSSEDAMKNLEDRWNKITEELGAESQAEGWATLKTAFPPVVDEVPA